MIAFHVPGAPQGKGRARSTKSGRHYTPATTVAYERKVTEAAKAAMGDLEPLEGPLEVILAAWLAPPKKTKGLASRPTKKPDADNISKIILDPLNGLVFGDDAQVVRLVVTKWWGDQPGVDVTVRPA